MPYLGSFCVPTWRMTPYGVEPSTIPSTNTRNPHLRLGTLAEHARSDAVRARYVVCNFTYFHVSTGEAALMTSQSAPSGAHMWDRRLWMSSDCV